MRKLLLLPLLLAASVACADHGATWYDNSNTRYLQIVAPPTLAGNYRIIMPSTTGTSGQIMAVDTVSGSTMTFKFITNTAVNFQPQIDALNVSTAALQGQIDQLGVATGTIQGQVNLVAVSTGVFAIQIAELGVSTAALSVSTAALAVVDSNLLAAINGVAASTGAIETQVVALQVSTGVIQGNVAAEALARIAADNAIGVSTGSLQTQITATALSTGTLAANFPISLSTNVTGILGPSHLVSTVAYTNVPNTFTSSQTVTAPGGISSTFGYAGSTATFTGDPAQSVEAIRILNDVAQIGFYRGNAAFMGMLYYLINGFAKLDNWTGGPTLLDTGGTTRFRVGYTGGISNESTVMFKPSATQAVTSAAYTILADAATVVLDPNADYALTSAPTIAAGTAGQILFLTTGAAETNIVTLSDQNILASSNLKLATDFRNIKARTILTLMYDGTNWVEQGYTLAAPTLGRLTATAQGADMP